MRLLYATSNSGKIFEVRRHLSQYGVEVESPAELGIQIEVPETGSTLEENALLKARAYHQLAPTSWILSDDTGLEIDALGGEPGIYARRWKDHQREMEDAEIIEYTLERMKEIPAGERGAQFRTVIAIIAPDGTETLVDGVLRGSITEEPAPIHIPGLPFEGLFYVPEWGKLLGDTRQFTPEEKKDWLSHRERAVEKAVQYLRQQTS